MNIYLTYGIIFVILLALELAYFKVADKFNIIDKPNERSSHSTIVLRGGGVIFALSTLVWAGYQLWAGAGANVMGCLPFLCGLMLIAGVSFVDDVRSLPDSVRLVAQFVAMGLMLWNLGFFNGFCFDELSTGAGSIVSGVILPALMVLAALIVCVGATNVINFMDGVNGITGGYALSVMIPLFLVNNGVLNGSEGSESGLLNSTGDVMFAPNSFLGVVILGLLVFCLFNFRPKGKAKCFAGDVGSISIAFIMLFLIGHLVMKTQDVTYLIFLLVYGVDGCLTICHRIMLHENLGEAHRKHAYQLMANELKMSHVLVSSLYASIQLIISIGFIYVCPNSVAAHWGYLVGAAVVLAIAYVAFKRKYYHLHEEYLASLKK